MPGPLAAESRRLQTRKFALAVLALGLACSVAVAAVQSPLHRAHSLGVGAVLGVAALASGFAVVPSRGRASVSSSFIVILLAAALLGPTYACGCAGIAELASAWRLHNPRYAIASNLFGSIVPALAAANLIWVLAPKNPHTASFYVVMAVAGAIYLILNFATAALSGRLLAKDRGLNARVFLEYGPSQVLNVALAVAGASIYVKVGLGGIVFALLAIFAFTYMAHLLEQSRHRSEQYVSLSWGVLAGLMRSLDLRDQRAARHAAAVARFARDMTAATGLSAQECELAHTAGLLHDIGHFALSDRVAERGRTLTEEDWVAIQRHPELGADMLRDLGMYGPVADIVLAHHERIDGRGYPHGRPADEIPEIAKIISVAEVYDTLTASDTYRTRMSSFEALRELRRVSGSQLDGRYVEVLAKLLSGEGVEYRHADMADFDTELNMERRIKEAGAGG